MLIVVTNWLPLYLRDAFFNGLSENWCIAIPILQQLKFGYSSVRILSDFQEIPQENLTYCTFLKTDLLPAIELHLKITEVSGTLQLGIYLLGFFILSKVDCRYV